MKTLRFAQPDELEACAAIIDGGRAFQKAQGFSQWTDSYPNRETLREDIAAQKGYVLEVDGKIAGYMCIDFSGEPAYRDIRGKWNTGECYAVVHRMAFSEEFRGQGLSESAFRLIEQLCRSKGASGIRVDTDLSNRRMQHILDKCGFRQCGTIVFQGGDKLAYDKLL